LGKNAKLYSIDPFSTKIVADIVIELVGISFKEYIKKELIFLPNITVVDT